MTSTNIASRQLRLSLLSAAERLNETHGGSEEFELALQTAFPHMRAQRYRVPPDVGAQFELERPFGSELAACFHSTPIDRARAAAIEAVLFPGAALLQAVDSFGLAAIDPAARGGWRVRAGMAPRTEAIRDLAPMLEPLTLALGRLWQREMRRLAKAKIVSDAVIRSRDMMEFIVDAVPATGWPFLEAKVREGKAALLTALRAAVAG